MEFPVSGVETFFWLPTVVAFLISCLTSMGGISGAFVILPFQVSILGFSSPAVSPTNLIFNIVAIPSGIYRFMREGRMLWPLAMIIVAGSLPGLLAGVVIRVTWLPDPQNFKLFAGFVLLLISFRVWLDLFSPIKTGRIQTQKSDPATNKSFAVSNVSYRLRRLSFDFDNQNYRVSNLGLFALSLVVGLVGGAYGVGGGAFIAPVLVSVYRLPVYTVAGAALTSTFVTSILGVIFYAILGQELSSARETVRPDFLLGLAFGLGGAAGMYLGARIQRYLPQKLIKLILGFSVTAIALKYILGHFL
ncbi:MAG: TSUP family transporter [candidate division Zixibacteria bacterium]|nr:TSUP family transporter [candidate division Zixibacteria bacterium]